MPALLGFESLLRCNAAAIRPVMTQILGLWPRT
jgi:hypothetical protein